MANDAIIQGRIGFDLAGPIGKEGPAGYRVIFDFTMGADVTADLSAITEQNFITSWQAMYVDNSLNLQDIRFTFDGTDQIITVKAGTQKYINILSGNPLVVFAHSTGNVRVTVFFLNFPVDNFVDLETVTAIISGTVTVTGTVTTVPLIVVVTNKSGTIALGGTAQDVIAANANRKSYAIENQSGGNLYIRNGADATLDQNALIIPPGFLYEPLVMTLDRISIIGATTGQAFWAREYT